jgi:hypothetical protein
MRCSMQATAVAGTKPGGGLQPRSPGCRQQHRECALAIDRIDRTVVTSAFPIDTGANLERVEPPRFVLGLAAAVARSAVLVVLALLAVLVLLPAAIAAQAAAAI